MVRPASSLCNPESEQNARTHARGGHGRFYGWPDKPCDSWVGIEFWSFPTEAQSARIGMEIGTKIGTTAAANDKYRTYCNMQHGLTHHQP